MKLLRRIVWWWNRDAQARALAEELAEHHALKQAELVRQGLSPDAAALAATRAMGNATWMREESRAVWIWPWLERLGQDIRYALRSARKAPTYSLGVIGITALGIGATTTVFSVVDGVLLRPLPYPNGERLVFFDNGSHSPPRFRDWQREFHLAERWGAARRGPQDMVGAGAPQRLMTAQVSPDFFEVFGVRPALGRLFTAGDYLGDGSQVVLSGRFWRGRFGADPGIVGRRFNIGGHGVEVVGVLDDRFVEPDQIVARPTDIWRPLVLSPAIANDRRYSILDIAARLKPGVSSEVAHAELIRVAHELFRQDPAVHGDGEGRPDPIVMLPLKQAIGREVDKPLWILLGAVGLMLLVACANLVNLTLARGADRARELAVRAALGAGRSRLARQLVTESVTLGLVAGAIGIVLAYFGVQGLSSIYPGDLPRAAEIGVDGRVASFAVVTAIVISAIAGLAPVFGLKSRWLNQAIKGDVSAGSRSRSRSGLVVAEVALALMLLVGSALLFRSFLAIVNVAPGFTPGSVGVANLVLGDRFTPEQRLAFASDLIRRIRAVPGILDASIGAVSPMARFGHSRCCWSTRGIRPAEGAGIDDRVMLHPVGARYFETIGATVTGRTVSDEEPLTPPYPVVISANLATKVFGAANPVGRRFATGTAARESGDPGWVVAGVVTGLHLFGLDQAVEEELFVPYRQLGGDFDEIKLLFRTAGDPAVMIPAVRTVIAEVDPSVPADDIVTMPEQVRRTLAQPLFYSTLMGTFGALALVLAAAGIYASMLYVVRQRRREMGIRVALGAEPGDIAWMVVSGAGRLAVAGVLIGGLGALGLSKLLRGFLFGVGPLDPVSFVSAGLILGMTAVAAAYLPARRAGQADPLTVIRTD
jgi:putative ABC transport system permease protein